ncbi:hypothetical protein FACS189429_1260 [Bacteroidia bacterium]|nr:hypothetical protein FACS189429_1260 [Bacteroidia bacterium]
MEAFAQKEQKHLEFKQLQFNRHDKLEKKKDSIAYIRFYAYDTLAHQFVIKDMFVGKHKLPTYRVGYSAHKPERPLSGVFTYYDTKDRKKSEGILNNNNKIGSWIIYSEENDTIISARQYYTTKGKATGNWQSWYEYPDKIRNNEYYENDSLQGVCTYYYANGQMSAIETYERGKLVDYKLFDEQGNQLFNENYEPDVNAVFLPSKLKNKSKGEKPNDYKELLKFIGDNLVYPEEAQKTGIIGHIFAIFVVETDGTVSDIEVFADGYKPFEKEARRVIQLTSGKWSSGIEHNRKGRHYFTLPITFKLRSF